MGSQLGVLKVAAMRVGLAFEDYMARLDAGLKWCTGCRQWKPKAQFGKNRARRDGLSSICLDCVTQRYNTKDVGTRARRAKCSVGLYWCRDCQDWRPRDLMAFGSNGYSSGLCREHYNSNQRRQYRSHPVRRRKAYWFARERKAKTKPILINEQRRLLELFGGRCAYCEERPFEEWDHFIPVAYGGKSIPGNILPSCQQCNRSKQAENPFEWIAKLGLEFSETVLRVINTPLEQVTYKHRRNPNQAGELNPTAKLTDAQAGKIRERYATGKHSYASLAQEYDVGCWVIARVVRGETYRHGNQD